MQMVQFLGLTARSLRPSIDPGKISASTPWGGVPPNRD
jgi:hypothetical protein